MRRHCQLIEEDTPRARPDVATAQLRETLRAGGGTGLMRETVELMLHELIEAEPAEAIGAGRCERSVTRTTEHNRHPQAGNRASLL